MAITIYNINIGNNPTLLAKSQTLLHYETLVELVRELAKTNDRGTAVTLAIEECFRRGILTDFLKTHGREVIMGILTEYDEDKVRTLWEDYWEEKGRVEGGDEVLALIEQGYSPDQIRKMRAEKPTTEGA